jgi:hypothetical protein
MILTIFSQTCVLNNMPFLTLNFATLVDVMSSGLLSLLFNEILRVTRRDSVRKQNYTFVTHEN